MCAIVKTTFPIDVARSTDKGQQLEVDQIGYRSFHFICGLGEKRVALPEFAAFKGRVFEVQVRTILQHAWAEVEHDRNYKFSGVLPSQLARRLYLISGLLEVGDRELNQLSRDIDAYAASVSERVKQGQLEDELNSATFSALIPEIAKELMKAKVTAAQPAAINLVVDECLSFGLKTTSDLRTVFTKEFLRAMDDLASANTFVGLTRDAMMFEDLERYLQHAWKKHWDSTDPSSVELLSKKYSRSKVLGLLKRNGIEIFDEPNEWSFAESNEQSWPEPDEPL